MSEQLPPSTAPLVSPDGRSWWNGTSWQPMPGVQPITVTQTTRSSPFVSGFVGCFGVAAALVFVLVLLILFGVCMTAASTSGGH